LNKNSIPKTVLIPTVHADAHLLFILQRHQQTGRGILCRSASRNKIRIAI